MRKKYFPLIFTSMYRNFNVTPHLSPPRGGLKWGVTLQAQIQKSVKTAMDGSFRNFEKVSQGWPNLLERKPRPLVWVKNKLRGRGIKPYPSFLTGFIIIPIFILTFAQNGFSENQSANERPTQNESSEIKDIKPDVSIELTIEPPQAVPEDTDDVFEDEDFDELDEEDEEEISDPIEPFNRLMWSFNENLYDYVMEPVARGYSKIFPEQFRKMVTNFFSNILMPVTLISSALQNNKEKVGRTLGRFLINSTLGIGGLFDPASSIFKIEKVNEDFDQALGYHNIPNGPYIMLPILGPSSLRGVFAKIPVLFLSPEFLLGIDFLPAAGARTEEIVNEVSFNLDKKKDLDDFALDPYTSVKDYYFQRRKVLVNE